MMLETFGDSYRAYMARTGSSSHQYPEIGVSISQHSPKTRSRDCQFRHL